MNKNQYTALKLYEHSNLSMRDVAIATGTNMNHLKRESFEGKGMPPLKKGWIR